MYFPDNYLFYNCNCLLIHLYDEPLHPIFLNIHSNHSPSIRYRMSTIKINPPKRKHKQRDHLVVDKDENGHNKVILIPKFKIPKIKTGKTPPITY